ncbi:GGDEF domain-containing protein [Pseudescherichia sp.]|uniref:GGDEF domain-containing protein n=1 Tax=Pseudescherichia sp. TaxID=2055881 RepID=UPI00289F327E|nr:GGDEF domain-containing protein [Pseudescherichia sp.]
MTAQTWHTLCNKKYQLSLRLFLFLNAVSALFSFLLPLSSAAGVTLPLGLLFTASVALLLWHRWQAEKKINIPLISLLFGGLWAWHVSEKYSAIGHPDPAYLLIALLSVLFIGTIAFSNNISAFILHSLPVSLSCLWLTDGSAWLRVLYCFALPVVGIAIQHVIQRRNDSFAQDLMDKLLAERKTLNDLSMLDPLTGLYNRRGLQNKIDNLLAQDDGRQFVLLLDIDHFKAYNDHYGHMMGDQALIRVSAAIRDAVRSRDIVARFGGEEFMILLSNVDLAHARMTAERIRQQVFDLKIPHMFNESVATNVTVSIGIAPLLDEDIEDALGKADKALYEAKHLGRNHILVSGDLQIA